MAWKTNGSGKVSCTECSATFVPPHSTCDCAPSTDAVTLGAPTPAAPQALTAGVVEHPLLTAQGRIEALAEMADQLSADTLSDVDIRRYAQKRQAVMAIHELTKTDRVLDGIGDVKQKLTAIEEAISVKQGFAARKSNAVVPRSKEAN